MLLREISSSMKVGSNGTEAVDVNGSNMLSLNLRGIVEVEFLHLSAELHGVEVALRGQFNVKGLNITVKHITQGNNCIILGIILHPNQQRIFLS